MGIHKIYDDEYIVSLWEAGYDAKRIAERAGCSISKAYLVRYEHLGHLKPKGNNAKRQEIVGLYAQGVPQIDIAKRMNVSRQYVGQVLAQDCAELHRATELHATEAKNARNRQITDDYTSGMRIEDIMTKYKITDGAMYYVLDKTGAGRRGRATSINARSVRVKDDNGDVVGEYPSIRQACIELDLPNSSRGNVSRYLKRGKHKLYGYYWEYIK